MMWPPYPICLDTSKHEDVECSLCIDMKTFGTLILQQSKVDASLFVFCPCSRTYHPMHDIDLSESLKIRTTVLYCIVLYSSIYIAPLNSQRQTEALVVRLAPRKETSFKK